MFEVIDNKSLEFDLFKTKVKHFKLYLKHSQT